MDDSSEANFETDAVDIQSSSPTRTSGLVVRLRATVANAVFYFGVFLSFLSGMDLAGQLPAKLPHFWYPVRLVWPFVGFAICYAGHRMRASTLEWPPQRPGRRFRKVVLYTRQDCHLCDIAKAVLVRYYQYLPPIEEVDIDKDAILIARFTTDVPVVELDGKVRFKGRVDEILLRRLIKGNHPVDPQRGPITF